MNTGYPDDVIFNAGIYDEKTYSFYVCNGPTHLLYYLRLYDNDLERLQE